MKKYTKYLVTEVVLGLLLVFSIAHAVSIFNLYQGGTGNGGSANPYGANVLVGTNATQFIATGTPQLTVGNLLATTTTATSTFLGNVLMTPSNDSTYGFNTGQVLEIVGSNPAGPIQVVVKNSFGNGGTAALSGYDMSINSTVNNGFSSSNYCATLMAGGYYNTPGFNGIKPGGMALVCSDGDVSIGSAGTNAASSSIRFFVGGINGPGFDTLSQDAILQGGTGFFGLATSSPGAKLSVTGLSNASGALMLMSTSTATATTTVFKIDNNGVLSVSSAATSTFNAGISLTSGSVSVTGQSTGCAQFGAGGYMTSTGVACGSGSGGDAFTHPLLGLSATTSQMIFGTSTANSYGLTIGTTTAPQLSLSAGIGVTQWTMRNAGGVLYFATTTTGSATSSQEALSISAQGTTTVNMFKANSSVAFGTTNSLYYDNTTSTTTITNAAIGALSFDNDAGVVTAFNLPVVSASAGTIESYSFNMDASTTPNMTIYGESDGAGGAVKQGVGVGTTTPLYPLTVFSTSKPQLSLAYLGGVSQWTLRNANGNLYFATTTILGTATSTTASFLIATSGLLYLGNYVNCNGATNALGVTNTMLLCDSGVSDIRLKKDVELITDGLSIIMKLNPVSFYWKDLTNHNTSDPRQQFGFVAQDVEKVIPSAVGESPDGFKTLDKTAIIPYLVDAVQKLALEKGVVIKRNMEENWQDFLIGLLIIGFIYQQLQINKLKK